MAIQPLLIDFDYIRFIVKQIMFLSIILSPLTVILRPNNIRYPFKRRAFVLGKSSNICAGALSSGLRLRQFRKGCDEAQFLLGAIKVISAAVDAKAPK